MSTRKQHTLGRSEMRQTRWHSFDKCVATPGHVTTCQFFIYRTELQIPFAMTRYVLFWDIHTNLVSDLRNTLILLIKSLFNFQKWWSYNSRYLQWSGLFLWRHRSMLYGSMEKFFYLWLSWWLPVTKIIFSVIDCAKYGWGLSPTNSIL